MDRYKLNNNKITNSINFDLGVGEDYTNNLFQSTLFDTSYIEKVKEENINSIIDYEKHIFYPAFLDKEIRFFKDGSFINKGGFVEVNNGFLKYSQDLDEYSHDINKIVFNLYLRRRGEEQQEYYEDWNVKDEAYWNKWDGTRHDIGNGLEYDLEHNSRPNLITMFNDDLDYVRSTKTSGDLLGYLGYNDNDVFYQKNNLKKSFLRISIYDSPYKQNQRLLYYSTLFFDTNTLYKKYTNLNHYERTTKNVNGEEQYIPRVYEYGKEDSPIPDEDKLTATFTCTSKLDNTASSDGFYLYLFNTIVNNDRCTPLYMKVEFNNAKYGKTVLLTCPRLSEKNKPVGIGNTSFPEHYEIEYGSEGHSYIDVNKLYKDLYIPIFVRYNKTKNRFEWYIADNEMKPSNSILENMSERNYNTTRVINLYEPRINKLKTT